MNSRSVVMIFLFFGAFAVHAHSESETNDVVAAMIDVLRWNDTGPCCVDESPDGEEATDSDFISMESLFEQHFGEGWPTNELKCSFDNYLLGLVNATNLSGSAFERGRAALECCAYRGYSNVFSVVRGIVRNPDASLRAQAWDVIVETTDPSPEMNSFIKSMVTNQTLVGRNVKMSLYRGYIPKLSRAYDAGFVQVATNGAHILYSASDCYTATRPLDELLQKGFPGYSGSSNRLAFAELFLSNPTQGVACWSDHYTEVTNRLHSLPQPLPEISELRP